MSMDIPTQKAHSDKIVAQFSGDPKGLEKLAQRCAFAEIRMGELTLEVNRLKAAMQGVPPKTQSERN
jgi:hypothetical protein